MYPQGYTLSGQAIIQYLMENLNISINILPYCNKWIIVQTVKLGETANVKNIYE